MGVVSRIQSFGAKITLLLTATSGLAVLLVCGILIGFAYQQLVQEAIHNLDSHAAVQARSSAAALRPIYSLVPVESILFQGSG